MRYFEDLSAVLQEVRPENLEELSRMVSNLRSRGDCLFLCGNGGSFANALHWGCDLVKQARVRAHVLGANVSLFSASANDSGYELSMRSEMERFAKRSDMLVCLSCSGRSRNILDATALAEDLGMEVVMLSGVRCPLYPNMLRILVHSEDYGIIEDAHAAIGHWLTYSLRGRTWQ